MTVSIVDGLKKVEIHEQDAEGQARSARTLYLLGAELEEAAARSTKVGDEEMSDDVRWIRSYVLDEGAGTVGTVCIYEASSPEAIREHASRADLPVDEIIRVADTVVVRPDPQPASA